MDKSVELTEGKGDASEASAAEVTSTTETLQCASEPAHSQSSQDLQEQHLMSDGSLDQGNSQLMKPFNSFEGCIQRCMQCATAS